MAPIFFRKTRLLSMVLAVATATGFAQAEPQHGIAMYGDPALPPDFVSLPYVNPDAPKGGRIVQGEGGSFDSLNPHIRKGTVPWQLRFVAYESLMGRSWDEPFTLYGLLAESIETPEDRSWVEFTLREEARFSDGSPVTIEDVIWSYETLGTIGHPRYHGLWKKIASMQQTGNRSLRITFNVEDRELALIVGMRPILKKAQWDGVDMREAPVHMIPISTAPYVIDDYDPGRFVSLKRNPDYWGNDLPFRRGTNNLDEIRMEFYADGGVMFEAFKGGAMSTYREFNAEDWETQYTGTAFETGDLIKSEIPHERPSGLRGFVMNTRRDLFQDWRVRDAMIHAFNFEYINDAITGGRQPRITSVFSNSVLGMQDGPATGRVAELLAPYAQDLLPGAIEGYALPASDGSERNRRNLSKAIALMEQAGWTIQDGQMKNADGVLFEFTYLLKVGANENEKIANIYQQALKRLGITMHIDKVDAAQHKERTSAYDFDMAYHWIGVSLSPGNEQNLYWGSEGVDTPGTKNWMGMNVPAAEAMIDALVTSTSREDFLGAVRALDRVIMSGRYVIPFHQFNISRVAHAKELKYPAKIPMYGDWIGWQPDVWWYEN